MARVREFGLEDLRIPNLAVKRHKLANGTIRCYVIETKTVWDSANKRAKPAYTKSVGVVENNSEFGRILFKDEFLERYPQLREVTVLRKESHQYVYRKEPPKTNDKTVGFHKPGKKRFKPANTQTKIRHCGATLLIMQIAQEYGLEAAVVAALGKHDARNFMAMTNAGVQLESGSFDRIEANTYNYWYGSDSGGLSSGALSNLMKRISARDAQDVFTKAMLRHSYKLGSGFELNFYSIDGTSISTKAENEFAARGFNKEHDKTKQLNLMVLVDQRTGIPVYWRLLTGDVNDVSAYPNDAKKVSKLLRDARQIVDLGDKNLPMVHVFDRGFVSGKNFDTAIAHGFDFVCSLSDSLKITKEARAYAAKKKLSNGRHPLSGDLETSHISHLAIPDKFTITNSESNRQAELYVHVYFNREKYIHRLSELENAVTAILAARQNDTYDQLPAQLKALDEEYKLVVKAKTADGTTVWTTNYKGCDRAAVRTATWVLGTTLKQLSGAQVYQAYKNRVKVEVAINGIKTSGGRRIRSGNDGTLQGRLFAAVYRGSLLQGLRHRAAQALKGAFGRMPDSEEAKYLKSIPKLLDCLNGVGCYVDDGQVIVTEITGIRRRLFEVLGFPLASNDEEQVPWEDLLSTNLSEHYTIQDAYEEGLVMIQR